MDEVRAEVAKWNPQEVERVTGLPEAQVKRIAQVFATQKPATLIWCMGATQKTVGTANVRAYSILCLATGNVGKPGTGANIFRGHTNVQGATDFGLDIATLPSYYGLDENAWRHWCRVWETDYEWMRGRFHSQKLMETPGIPSTRWFDAVVLPARPDRAALQVQGPVRDGPWRQHRHPHAGDGEGAGAARTAGGRGPAPHHLRPGLEPAGRHLPAADLHQLRDGGQPRRLQPLAAMGRAGGEAHLREPQRLRRHVRPGEAPRLRRPDVQEHRRPARRLGGGRGHHARVQSRDGLHGLLRPVAGAAQAAHGEPGELRHRHPARQAGHAGRGRVLRPALALLGHAGDEAPRHPHPLQHRPAREGGRRHLPRPLRRGAQRPDPAGRGQLAARARRSRTATRSSPSRC